VDINALLSVLTPEIYEKFKKAIELGKWESGEKLSEEQRATCFQSLIAYEHEYLEKEQRTAYVPPKPTPCGSAKNEANEEGAADKPLVWKK